MIINGTIYVKKEMKYRIKPRVFLEDFNGIRIATPEELEFIKLFDSQRFEQKTEIDLDENFWIIFLAGNKIFMHNHNKGTYEEYNNIDEVNERFISLESYIEQSSYLGKQLILPAGSEIIKNGRNVYLTKPRPEYIILYILHDSLIIKELEGNQEYKLISRFNPEFSKYVIDNEINPEYADKNQVYQDIIAQIYHKGKKDNQELQR